MSTKNISRGCCFSRNAQNKAEATSIEGGHKMEVWDWLDGMPRINPEEPKILEVRFKNTRKSFFVNSENLELKKGDVVAVEGNPGTDIGIITMTSDLVKRQIKRTGFRVENGQFKKVLRLANAFDVERWSEAISREHATMIESRQISVELGLDMKIGDVEYQGDGMKAIFYYIADGRVDFRELIKVLFDRFRVRIEMKQIGARQEAGRIGGIGPCGRQLCCSSWMNNFTTIGIGAARTQDISLNPQKLAGQCGKLKCCLNYEVDSYIDAKKAMPRVNAPLEAMDGKYFLVKSDPLARTMYFSPSQHESSIFIPLSVERVREIMAINQRGEKVSQLFDEKQSASPVKSTEIELQNIELEDSLTRFDKKSRGNRNGNQQREQRNNRPRNNNNQNREQNNRRNGNNKAAGAEQKGEVGENNNANQQRPPRPKQPRQDRPQRANNANNKPENSNAPKQDNNTQKPQNSKQPQKQNSQEGGGEKRNNNRGNFRNRKRPNQSENGNNNSNNGNKGNENN